MNRVVMHVDMDAFFASVEQLANPAFRGKPLFVTAVDSIRSVVAACSYEARPFGVRSGMPVQLALRKCPHAILVQGNPGKYVHISTEILNTLKTFTPWVEPYSIDESFMEFDRKEADAHDEAQLCALGMKVKTAVRKASGLACSVGIGPNKLVAKTATSFGKPDGIYAVTPDRVDRFIQQLPIKDLFGIGPRLLPVFERLGVVTVGDLRKFERERLRELFGVNGDYFYDAARGINTTPLVPYWEEVEVKSVGHSHTLEADTNNRDKLVGLLHVLCSKVYRRMEVGEVFGRTVNIVIRYGNFSTITRSVTQATPIESESMIYHLAKGLFFGHWNGRTPIRLLGIAVSNLCSSHVARQKPLYIDPHDRKMDDAGAALRKIQRRYGEFSIHYGSTLCLSDRPLNMPHGLGHTGLAGPLQSKAEESKVYAS